MRRSRRPIVLCAAAAALALPTGAQAAVTESTVTAPTGPFYALQDTDLPDVPIRVVGTTDGDPGDLVDIRCYYDGTYDTLASAFAVGAAGAVDTNTLAPANRPDLGDLPDDYPCIIRIVPNTFSGSLVAPYQGPVAAKTSWDDDANDNTVEGGAPINVDYSAEVPRPRAYSEIDGAGNSALDEMQGFIPGTEFQDFDEYTWEAGAEISKEDEDGTRSSIIVDGVAAYLPTNLPRFDYGGGVNSPIGSKGTTATIDHDAATGRVTITETSPVQRCNVATDISPAAGDCTAAVSTGISLVRTSTVRPGGQVTAIRDRWVSTDGAAHNLRVEYYNEGEYDDYPLWKFPGDLSFRFYDDPATVFPGGPGTVLLKDSESDGGDEMAPGALGYNPAPDFFYFTDYDYLPEVSTFAVPASGEHVVTRTFAVGENSAEAAAIGAAVEDEFVAPTVTITAPANGSAVAVPQVTVTGTAVDNQGVVSLTVNGAPTALGAGGAFSAPVTLAPGANTIKVVATDASGGATEANVAVTYVPPAVPGPPTGPGPTPPATADTTRPVVSMAKLTPATFAVAAGSTATSASARPRKGTRISYRLSEAARATITIERRTTGRRRSGRCVAPTRALRRARAKTCVRYVRVGALTRRGGKAGANTVAFSGRIGTKALRIGRHRVSISAVDAAGNRSRTPSRATFRVVRAR